MENVEEKICKYCEKPFDRKKYKTGHVGKRALRPVGSVTCCTLCSRRNRARGKKDGGENGKNKNNL